MPFLFDTDAVSELFRKQPAILTGSASGRPAQQP
jgi:predicted nucleic acid-binding protein